MALSKEENEMLTRVGPGTPAGEMLRRYWQPIGLAAELADQGVGHPSDAGDPAAVEHDRVLDLRVDHLAVRRDGRERADVALDDPGPLADDGRPPHDRPHDLRPGLHWRWPWPVEVATRLQPDRVHVVEVGFRTTGPATGPPALSWASPHGDGLKRIERSRGACGKDSDMHETEQLCRSCEQIRV